MDAETPQRQAVILYLHLAVPPSPQKPSKALLVYPYEPFTAYQPVDCEYWLDLRAGDEIVARDGTRDTVIGVGLMSSSPPMSGKPLMECGRTWERTGLDIDGNPTKL